MRIGPSVDGVRPLQPQDALLMSPHHAKVLLLVPAEVAPHLLVPADQAWYWTEEWQRGEREAEASIVAGQTLHFEDADSFKAWLTGSRE